MPHRPARSRRSSRVAATLLALTAAAVAVLIADAFSPDSSDSPATTAGRDIATVDRVIDGDTVDVLLHGEVTRIRLLNIDTPETKRKGYPIECLGPEASAFVDDLLPEGTEVTLDYDEIVTDQYGRTLAAVYKGDVLVNAAIARAGLATSVVYDGNDRFLGPVQQAEDEAEAEDLGLHADPPDCG